MNRNNSKDNCRLDGRFRAKAALLCLFYLFPAQYLGFMPTHVHKEAKGNPMLLGVHLHDILYDEIKADLLRPEVNVIFL